RVCLLHVERAGVRPSIAQAGLDGREQARGQAEPGQEALLRIVELAVEEACGRPTLAPHALGRHEQAGVIGGLEEVAERPVARPGGWWRDGRGLQVGRWGLQAEAQPEPICAARPDTG